MEIKFYGECNCAVRTACAPAFGVPLHGLGCPAGTANEQWLWRELSGERAAREKAEGRADNAIQACRKWARDEIRWKADLAQARKERDASNEDRAALAEERMQFLKQAMAAEAARDAAIRLLREAKPFLDRQHALDVEAEGGPCEGCDCCEQIKTIDAFLAKNPAATGDTPSDPAAVRTAPPEEGSERERELEAALVRLLEAQTLSFSDQQAAAMDHACDNVLKRRVEPREVVPVPREEPKPEPAWRSSEEMRGGVSTSDKPFAAIIDAQPEPAGRSEDEAMRVARAVQPYGMFSDAVETIRAALAAAERRGLDALVDRLKREAEDERSIAFRSTAASQIRKLSAEGAATAYDVVVAWIEDDRALAAEPEKAS